ncbi:hypothetical protein [Methanobacterium sp. SMA-27]|uniref:hypothetical protein n=1 Tax=Methanobacterium sp. SMA-27 TaxID=1495336 RepID=UPI0012E0BFE6|nr:hypothetical protein [Methanobacterium sp. SMA-27]
MKKSAKYTKELHSGLINDKPIAINANEGRAKLAFLRDLIIFLSAFLSRKFFLSA